MMSFFWIVTFLFVILLVAQWTVLLCVRKYMLALPKFHFGFRNLAILGLSVIVNLVIAYLSIMPFGGDNDSVLKQFISVSYFFFLGICLALFVFFLALGGIDLLFGAYRSALDFIMREKRSTYQAVVDDEKKLNYRTLYYCHYTNRRRSLVPAVRAATPAKTLNRYQN